MEEIRKRSRRLAANVAPNAREGVSDDVAEEILLRIVCCKSLMRFRAVCKCWRSTIDDPRFRYLRNLRSAQRPTAFLFSFRELPTAFLFSVCERLEVARFLGDESRSSTAVVMKGPTPMATPSSHGLVCVYDKHRWRDDFVVCNPISGEKLFLSRPPRCDCVSFGCGSQISFGYHPPTKKYKVVTMCKGHCHVRSLGGGGGTSSSSSWRTVEFVEVDRFNLPLWLPPALFCYDGVLHWFIVNEYKAPTLLTFDLGTEEIHGHFPTTTSSTITSNSNIAASTTIKMDLSGIQGIGSYHFTRVIMLLDSGQTIDVYNPYSCRNRNRTWHYRKTWSFNIVKDHEEEGPADAASRCSGAVGPLCMEMDGTLICDEQGFRSQFHLHLLKKMGQGEKYRHGNYDINKLLDSSVFPAISIHAETLVSLKDL